MIDAMIALVLALTLVQAAPAVAAPELEATPATQATPEHTLAGLREVYSTTCGQTGILYHAYDDLCEGLRKQIRAYERKTLSDAKTLNN